jgi:ThiC-associated domain
LLSRLAEIVMILSDPSFCYPAAMKPNSKTPMAKAALGVALCSAAVVNGFVVPVGSLHSVQHRVSAPAAAGARSDVLRMIASPPEKIHTHLEAPGAGRVKPTKDPFNPQFKAAADFGVAYPSSTKEYKEVVHETTGALLRVPFRRIHLTDPDPGCSSIDVYDTSGPLGFNPKDGLPKVRLPWIKRREERGDERCTQV